jgi:hypothetical protein
MLSINRPYLTSKSITSGLKKTKVSAKAASEGQKRRLKREPDTKRPAHPKGELYDMYRSLLFFLYYPIDNIKKSHTIIYGILYL